MHPAPGKVTDSASGQRMTALAQAYATQISQLLGQATALDEDTVRALNAHQAPTSATDSTRTPVARESIPRQGTDPKRVHQWWDSLTLDQQDDQLTAQRHALDQREEYLRRLIREGRLNEAYRDASGLVTRDNADFELAQIDQRQADLDGKLKGLHSIENRLANTDPNQPRAYLIGLSTQADGKAIVSVGNPDTADNILTYVPGTGSDLSKIGGDIRRVDLMARDANGISPGSQTAVIAWLGYDAPDTIPEAGLDSHADGGVADLSRFQNGLRVTHDGPTPSHNVVLGHSYGTTVVGHTAEQTNLYADDIIFVASPGVDAGNYTALGGIPRDHVWATRAEGDPIEYALDTRAHGADPAQPGFGGNVFTSDPGGHSSYWSDRNIARRNIALIVTGQGGVTLCPQPDEWRPWLSSS